MGVHVCQHHQVGKELRSGTDQRSFASRARREGLDVLRQEVMEERHTVGTTDFDHSPCGAIDQARAPADRLVFLWVRHRPMLQ